MFIDAIVFNVRDNGVIKKQAAYIILGISEEGKKEVLTITIGETESAKYWLSILNELKNRGVQDILVLCADGLTGIKEAIEAAYPLTEYQRCIKYVSYKDRKAFATDLKTVYHASDEQTGHKRMLAVAEKWQSKYPNSMQRWAEGPAQRSEGTTGMSSARCLSSLHRFAR